MNAWQFLDGKKTYILAAIGVIYIFGGDQGWWNLNEAIAAMLGFGGLASLRAGKTKPAEPARTGGNGAAVIPLLVCGVGIALTAPGCATLEQAATPTRVKAIAKLAAYTACVHSAGVTGEGRENWLRAYSALSVMVQDENWDAATLGAALTKAGIPEMIGSEGQLTIAGGVALLDIFTGAITQIGADRLVRAVAEGALEGIDLALNDVLSPSAKRTLLTHRAAQIEARLRAEAEATRPKK